MGCAKGAENRRGSPISRQKNPAQPIDLRALSTVSCNSRCMDVKAAEPGSAEVIDFFDYVSPEPRTRPQSGGVERRTARSGMEITDDWPAHVPVTEAELDLFEVHFGPLLDELLGSKN